MLSPTRHIFRYVQFVRVSKDRPSTVLGVEESFPRERRRFHFGDRSPTHPMAAFVVLHHLGGLLLPNPVRVLHRTSSHGVRDVSSPRQRLLVTCSYPSKFCSPRAAGRLQIAPSSCRARVTLPGHPGRFTTNLTSASLAYTFCFVEHYSRSTLPSRTCCPNLEVFLRTRSRDPHPRCR